MATLPAPAWLRPGISETPPSPPSMWPLARHVSGRYLADQQGVPFFVQGDTAWSLFLQLDNAEIVTYLDTILARGFNAFLCNGIEREFTNNTPKWADALGNSPFTSGGGSTIDFEAPNDAYFNRFRDYVLAPALARDMLVIATPIYLGYGGGSQGFWSQIQGETTTTMRAWGEYLGAKFAAYPNIIWQLGGDYYDAAVLTRVRAVAEGLIATGHAGWLYTYHSNPEDSSRESVGGEAWLGVNSVYSYNDVVGELQAAYAALPAMPMYLFETRYEGEGDPIADAFEIRRNMWWSVLAGGCGHIFGNNPRWGFDLASPIFPYGGSYTGTYNSQGTLDIQRMGNFFRSLDWHLLVPDTTNTVMTAGHQSGTSEALCAIASDESFAVVYMPSSRQVTIDMTEFGGPNVLCRWFNPTTAGYTTIGTYANTGTRNFTPSSGDWALLLEGAA
jgi:hypothetical protein